ncbi:MAG: hypothetical protein NTY65_05950 [Planctomycetota bacterium]|nr:hypothetical protein [Planctomycetota bacterium]
MIRVRCPKCDAKVEVDESFAGRPGRCATCGYDFRVPKTGEATSTRGMVEPSRPGATVVKVDGESVELVPPLEILAVIALTTVCLSVVAVLAIGLSGLWTPPWAVGMALGALLSLLGTIIAVPAYHNISRSRGRKRGKGLATAALAAGGGLFLVFLVGFIIGWALSLSKPPCEENLKMISVALGNYAKKHNGAFPDGHKANLSTLVQDGYLSSTDYLTCPAYPVTPGTQTYSLTPDLNNRDFSPETMIISDGPPYEAHKDGMVRVLLLSGLSSGKIITVPAADWPKFKDGQEKKWNDTLNKIRRAKVAPKAEEAPAPPEVAPPAPAAPAPVITPKPPAAGIVAPAAPAPAPKNP